MARISVEARFREIRAERDAAGKPRLPETFQGIGKERIRKVLGKLGFTYPDLANCVFALLDDVHESLTGFKFSDGATTAQLGSHIAFLQGDGHMKLDREGRDYWIKPLVEIGAAEPVTLIGDKFVVGHVIAKSPNSSYRLDRKFVEILEAPQEKWEGLLTKWNSKDSTRRRLEMQAKATEESRKLVDSGHKALIAQSISSYAKHFLPEFEVIYDDDADGDRVTEAEKAKMKEAGVTLGLEDAWPDVLLWNRTTDELWCIEAVTSDGEVDSHKVQQLEKLAERHGKKGIGFTTTYLTWKSAAARQHANRNLAIGSYVWIAEDPSRQFEVHSFKGLMVPEPAGE